MKMLDLFSGIGGFSLAASWTGSIETVAFCEIDPYCQKVLYKHWPDVPIYPDIKELRGEDVGSVDIVCGGFPCQPFSCAGKQRGKEDDRYLWPEMFRVIQEAHPTWVISENVAGFVNMGLDDCISDLESEGYEVQPLVIPACAVNAPHRRDRVWIIAYNNAIRRDVWGHQRQGIQRRDKTCDEADSSSETMADTNRTRELQPQGSIQELRGWISDGGKDVAYPERQGSQRLSICEMEGASQFTKGSWWDVEPNVGGSNDGLSRRLHGGGIDGTSKENRTREILQDLPKETREKTLQRQIGGLQDIHQSKSLQPNLCQYQTRTNRRGVEMESGATPRECLQCVRFKGESPCSSYQRRYNRQSTGEYSDIMRVLPCQTSSFYPEAWADGSWEDGIPRVATGVPDRIHRLKGLGNAIVPQVVYPIFQTIIDIENQIKT